MGEAAHDIDAFLAEGDGVDWAAINAHSASLGATELVGVRVSADGQGGGGYDATQHQPRSLARVNQQAIPPDSANSRHLAHPDLIEEAGDLASIIHALRHASPDGESPFAALLEQGGDLKGSRIEPSVIEILGPPDHFGPVDWCLIDSTRHGQSK